MSIMHIQCFLNAGNIAQWTRFLERNFWLCYSVSDSLIYFMFYFVISANKIFVLPFFSLVVKISGTDSYIAIAFNLNVCYNSVTFNLNACYRSTVLENTETTNAHYSIIIIHALVHLKCASWPLLEFNYIYHWLTAIAYCVRGSLISM